MRTIVHLFGTLDAGGAEMRTLAELRVRRRPDERHVLVAMSGRRGVLDAEFEALGCEVVHHPLTSRFPVWMVRFLRQRRATHVHSHVHLASGYLLLLARLGGARRRIAHFRSSGDGREGSIARRTYRRIGRLLVATCATDLVAVSAATRAAVFGDGPLAERCTVLYNRVTPARFPVAPDPTLTSDGRPRARIVVVGRLDRDKNPRRAVDIVAALARRGAVGEVALRFVGRGTDAELEDVRRRAEELGVARVTALLGQRSDVPQLLADHDLLLSTTLREGLPGAVIESSAAGIPAVVSAIPPNEEAAGWLPGVTVVPLAADDDEWCEVIETALRARRDGLDPSAVRAGFERSPFALSPDQAELDHLWG